MEPRSVCQAERDPPRRRKGGPAAAAGGVVLVPVPTSQQRLGNCRQPRLIGHGTSASRLLRHLRARTYVWAGPRPARWLLHPLARARTLLLADQAPSRAAGFDRVRPPRVGARWLAPSD